MDVLGASSFHVGQGGVALVSRLGVLTGAASVIFVEITAVGPAVVGIVVSSLGTGGALASGVAARLLLCWRRGLCRKGLCNGLVDDRSDVMGRRGHTGVGDDAWEACRVQDGWCCVRDGRWAGQESVLHALD